MLQQYNPFHTILFEKKKSRTKKFVWILSILHYHEEMVFEGIQMKKYQHSGFD